MRGRIRCGACRGAARLVLGLGLLAAASGTGVVHPGGGLGVRHAWAEQAAASPLPDQQGTEEPASPVVTAPSGTMTQDLEASPVPAGPPAASAPTGTAAGAEKDTFFVDDIHEVISRGLLTSAVWLDSFFGDERFEAESNQSHFKVSQTMLFEDGDWTRYRPDYELRLVLPQMRQKTRLVISGDMWADDQAEADAATPTLASTPPQDREVNTVLQIVLPSHKRHSTTIRGGAKYSSGDFVYYGGPRYRYLFPFNGWTSRLTENIVWYTDKGWESITRLDLERPLPRDLFFRASAEGTWTENVNGYLHTYIFLLRQPLDSKRAVEYEWINYCHTRPVNELTEVKVLLRYRQQIWRRWLFLEIAPQYRFPRDRGFEDVPGINFKLEMIFDKPLG